MDVEHAIRAAIEQTIDDSQAEVRCASPGHFEITVRARAFDGKRLLEKQRMVLGAIKHLMAGDAAPVHAVDRIVTLTE
ncbi:MAG: BolA/IbaG family iron-sulfur metabolism protein [Myxococcota bacterium]